MMPQVSEGPKALNDLLESAYSSCIAGGGTEASCSRQAWGAAKAAGWKKNKEDDWMKEKNVNKAVWTGKFINSLPDVAFAYIEPGGEKDDDGKTKPRSLKHFPHHNASVKSSTEMDSVDLPHLRNALARLPQSTLPDDIKAKIERHLKAHAKQHKIGEFAKCDDKVKKRLDELEENTDSRLLGIDEGIENIETQISRNAEESLWQGVI